MKNCWNIFPIVFWFLGCFATQLSAQDSARIAFNALPEEDRVTIQSVMKAIGFYESTVVDGHWAESTESSISEIAFNLSLRNIYFNWHKPDGAAELMAFLLSEKGQRFLAPSQNCLGCKFVDNYYGREPPAQDRPLRDSFVLMGPGERHNIQYFLSAKKLYFSDIDGLWGAGTEASVLALHKAYPEMYAQFDINTPDGAAGFLRRIGIDYSEEYPEGGYEGEPDDMDVASPDQNQAALQTVDLEAKCKGAASFLGLCWRLSKAEMETVVNGRGFSCGPVNAEGIGLIVALGGGKLDIPERLCTNPETKAAVLIYANRLSFNCSAFNICNYNILEMAQIILDEGYLRQMDPYPEYTGEGELLEKYCGRTADGQEICAATEVIYTLKQLKTISLSKGAMGQGGVSFN